MHSANQRGGSSLVVHAQRKSERRQFLGGPCTAQIREPLKRSGASKFKETAVPNGGLPERFLDVKKANKNIPVLQGVAFEPLQLQSARAQRSDGHKNRDHKILTTPIVELLGTSLTLDRVRFAVHAIKRLLAFESSIRQHHFKPLIDTIGAVLLSHSYLARTCAVSLDSGYVRKPHSSESFQALTRHDRCGSPLTSNLARISPVPAPFPSIPDTFESPIRQNHFKPLLDTIGAVLLSHSYLARTCAVSLDSGYVRKPHSSESFQALTRHDRCGSPLT
ncbi:uncharacterized protein EDB91DRAFT_1089059, partial [Suillus paluster]|uniref:uncharacterized protein n=1 Tax=Suillus paluster TaxID=48578 RepID=UPI001B875016